MAHTSTISVFELLVSARDDGTIEAAYFRSLYFQDPPREKAAAIYSRYHSGGVPSEEEYRTFYFQSFLF